MPKSKMSECRIRTEPYVGIATQKFKMSECRVAECQNVGLEIMPMSELQKSEMSEWQPLAGLQQGGMLDYSTG